MLDALAERAKPTKAPSFPGTTANSEASHTTSQHPEHSFPGKASSAVGLWQEKLEFLREQEAITADPAQKFALKKQIEEAKEKISELGGNPP